MLKDDLEYLRTLTELTRKRESRKLRQAEIIQGVLNHSLFYHEPVLRDVFGKIILCALPFLSSKEATHAFFSMDKGDYFKSPVSRVQVPDYFDVIKKPFCWDDIERKLDNHEYWDLKTFQVGSSLSSLSIFLV